MTTSGGPLRVTVISTLTGIITVSPVFLLGASGVLVGEELGFDESGLGNAVAVFFACAALGSVPLGRLSERLGASNAMRLAAAGSAVSLLMIALGVRTYAALLVALALAGIANGMSQPSTALALVRGVPRRQGLVFGIKQASVPVTTLLAGLSVPLLGVQVGWRWSFAIASLAGLLVLLGIPRRISEPQPRRRAARPVPLRDGDAATAPLVLLSVGALLGNAAATAMAAFLVVYAVSGGMSIGIAGWLLAGGSVVGAASRLAVGGLSDRLQGRALQLVAALLGFGSVGYLLIATGISSVLLLGVAVVYGLAWGWPGTLMYAVTRLNQNAPGAAAGIVQVGASGGGVVGPPIFGWIVTRNGYTPAWLFAATAAALACVNVLVARAWLRRDRHRREQRAQGPGTSPPADRWRHGR